MLEKPESEEGFYYNKVKEYLTDQVENHGLRDMNIFWSDDAYNMSLEERCKWWLEFMEGLENGSIKTETMNDEEWDLQDSKVKINVRDYLNIIDNQDYMLHNPHMES